VPRVCQCPESRGDVLPTLVILDLTANQRGDEGTPPSRTHTSVDFGYQLVVQGYV